MTGAGNASDLDGQVGKLNSRRSLGAAGVGGASTGTGLAGIGQLVGPHTVVGEILIYVAPVFSVVSGVALSRIGYMLKVAADGYVEKAIVKKARQTLEKQLNDPNLSDSHKDKIRHKLEEVSLVLANKEVSRVKAIKK